MLSPQDLILLFKAKGIPRFRALQVMHAVFKEGKNAYEQITTLPIDLKKKLQDQSPIFSIEPIRELTSRNGETQKVLFQTSDKLKLESVLMYFQDGRHSVCVSSQIGCQLGCKFCATGTMKFGRNLTYEEIADQALYFAQKLHQQKRHISNIVYMGMGEPFMNYDNVIKSIKLLNDKDCLHIGARNITISTSGICEGIAMLADEPIQIKLAVSLHAPNQELRQKIMPIAKKYSLEQLMVEVKKYLKKTGRRISYEYVMLHDLNDHEAQAIELTKLVKDQLCHINLIPYNATAIHNISGSARATIQRFSNIIKKAGIPVTIRVTLGQDIDAACGQLANIANK